MMSAFDRLRYSDGILLWVGGPRRGCEAGTINNAGYKVVRLDGRLYLVHRVIWFLHYGTWPEELDHINRDKTDNRLENLRVANRKLNNQNVDAAGYVKYRGKYLARIHRDGKTYQLGTFSTANEAHSAYMAARDD